MKIRSLLGSEAEPHLADIARVRMEVFAEYPYLMDADEAREVEVLSGFIAGENSVLVVVFDGLQVVGASTGSPIAVHDPEFSEVFAVAGFDTSQVFYCAESALLPRYRGQGLGHAFFDQRESYARSLGMKHSAFCSVVRPESHAKRVAGYAPLDKFWKSRGYRILPGLIANFDWTELGADSATPHPMQFWLKELDLAA